MKISILTLFPEMFIGPLSLSIIKRAQDKKLVEINYVNIRDFGLEKHKVVDDTPYGGGVGMVMRVDVLHRAIEFAKESAFVGANDHSPTWKKEQRVVLLDPRGKTFDQPIAKRFSKLKHLILICGHYEGYDERIRQFVDEEISIGDFILTGGEIPAMTIVDTTVRLLPGVLADTSVETESFSIGAQNLVPLLESPTYTKPPEYEGLKVPEILLSGNHGKIEEWKKDESLKITKKHRPDLIKK